MFRFGLGLAFACWGATAFAADKPVYEPPAAWVRPAALPAAPSATDSAAVQVLLADQQYRLDPAGEEFYSETAVKIQTPQGLQAVGNLAFAWNPETSTLVVHKLHVIRAGQTIDLLAKGQSFTILRRENNLERAMLDGTLTAAIQPEGLQVGDVLDFALTLKHNDPIMMGHVEAPMGRVLSPVSRLQMRAIWPKGSAVRWRQEDGLPAAMVSSTTEGQELSVVGSDLQPSRAPKGAPGRFAHAGMIDISDFADWSAVSALMAPLYVRAEALSPDSPLLAEAAKIRAATTDPKARAAAALKLVQDRVRYLFLGMKQGGYVPAPADVTWTRLFADCKGKTVLLLALLHQLGVEAEPAFVSTTEGDGLDTRLPMVGVFDHVIVRAVIGGKVYWLDGTRLGDRDLDSLQVPPFTWALPVQERGARLEKLELRPLDKPNFESTIHLDASAGLDLAAPVRVELVMRGDYAFGLKQRLDNMTAPDRARFMKDYWKGQYDFIEVQKTAAEYDSATGEERFSMDGSARMAWDADGKSRQYESDGMRVGWKPDFDRDPGPNREAPFVVGHPSYTRFAEFIVLPNHGQGFEIIGADVDRTLAGVELKRTSSITKGVFAASTSTRSIVPEIPFSQARADEGELLSLSKVRVYVRSPTDYRPTEQETASLKAKAGLGAMLNQGHTLMMKGDNDGALAVYNRALAIDSTSAIVLANRGAVFLAQNKFEAAQSDFDRAVELDPRQAIAFYGRGLLEAGKNRFPEALADYSQAINIAPNLALAYVGRGITYSRLRQIKEAQADFDKALQLDPKSAWAFAQRAFFEVNQGQPDAATTDIEQALAIEPNMGIAHGIDGLLLGAEGRCPEAIKELDRAIEISPRDADSFGVRGGCLNELGRYDEAMADFDKALAINQDTFAAVRGRARALFLKGQYPQAIEAFAKAVRLTPKDPWVFFQRAEVYRLNHQDDLAAADIATLLSLEPQPAKAHAMLAQLYERADDHQRALGQLDEAVRSSPDDVNIRQFRASVLGKTNQYDKGLQDLDFAFSEAPHDPQVLNSRCWYRAIAGRDLDAALSDCNAAIGISPDSAGFLDSRGLVELRLGHYAKAIADYDAAIRLRPHQGASLYGRGIAKLRSGASREGEADLAAARTVSPKIDAEFSGYGVKP